MTILLDMERSLNEVFHMETEKFYYADPFLKEFIAVVQSCEVGKDGFLAALDRIAFYREGSGQPAERRGKKRPSMSRF